MNYDFTGPACVNRSALMITTLQTTFCRFCCASCSRYMLLIKAGHICSLLFTSTNQRSLVFIEINTRRSLNGGSAEQATPLFNLQRGNYLSRTWIITAITLCSTGYYNDIQHPQWPQNIRFG